MKIVVIGTTEGAGATFISTNLAFVSGWTYLDLNKNAVGHTLFEVENTEQKDATVCFCKLEANTCGSCSSCASVCKKGCYKQNGEEGALYCVGCPTGECEVSCDKDNLTTQELTVGKITVNKLGKQKLIHFTAEEGYFKNASECAILECDSHVIMDCPPADAYNVLDCIKLADYCLIVAEPGAIDFEGFKALIRLCKLAGKPYGTIINKLLEPYDKLTDYCNLHSTEILTKIPLSSREEKMIVAGRIIAKEKSSYKRIFEGVIQNLKRKKL